MKINNSAKTSSSKQAFLTKPQKTNKEKPFSAELEKKAVIEQLEAKTQKTQKKFLTPKHSAFNLLFIGWAVIMLDQITKFLALIYLRPINKISMGVFDLSYMSNSGAAFGLLEEATDFLSIISFLFVLQAVIFALSLIFAPKSSLALKIHKYTKTKLGTLSFGLILGGAAGNLIDRAIRKYVIDFIDFQIWPVFNFADACIVLGVFGIILVALRIEKKDKQNAQNRHNRQSFSFANFKRSQKRRL